MKKIILTFILLLSINCLAFDYSTMCAAQKPKKNFTGTLTSLTGLNFTAKKITESQIEKALKKETGSKFNIKIGNFFGVNLLGGDFGKVTATSNDIYYEGFYFSSFMAETICPYNSVEFNDDNVKFNENLVLKYTTTMTQQDLMKTIKSTQYQKFIDNINKNAISSSLVSIKNPSVKIKEDNLLFEYDITPLPGVDLGNIVGAFIKPTKVSMNASLSVVDGKIQLSNLKLNNSGLNKYNSVIGLVNAFNPLSFDVKPTKDTKGKMQIDNVKIEDSLVKIVGYLVIPKDE